MANENGFVAARLKRKYCHNCHPWSPVFPIRVRDWSGISCVCKFSLFDDRFPAGSGITPWSAVSLRWLFRSDGADTWVKQPTVFQNSKKKQNEWRVCMKATDDITDTTKSPIKSLYQMKTSNDIADITISRRQCHACYCPLQQLSLCAASKPYWVKLLVL